MYTYNIRSVVGVYTPVGVVTEWLWSVHSKLECTLRQGKGGILHANDIRNMYNSKKIINKQRVLMHGHQG